MKPQSEPPKPGPRTSKAERLRIAFEEATRTRPSNETPDLTRCLKAFWTQIGCAVGAGKNNEEVLKEAGIAYRQALPPLTSLHAIRSQVNCIAHGVAIGAFDAKQASLLLYAAQVALSTIKRAGKGGKH